ncbi:5'-methylthioadenosine/S-adenosylhomocysteine nucleosidase [Halobacillus salinarum]|uniref:5'-methylthioadenosine/S-adenosylhomocysteine nucleosidase n=1 Tax=Halobacillus salinarum TaxID=2932257 RepID=A0ABY4ERM4_9BACI|nr:5'-methylthioadenosine/S-adenosylhomocysteine nucleosidase [Halobacillus salinarum]UOQ46304.1 5'-methylthioadenosine/S-adenosylhomocysteine nucleosidase [Halobacillus salinarum]
MIGIIGAMDEEIELLEKEMNVTEKNEIAGSLFIQGTLCGKEIVLLKSGIGKVNAAVAATIMQERYPVQAVINTGSAGGFAADLEVGDIIISSYVTYHDVDVTAFEYEYGQIPDMPSMYKADGELVQTAVDAAHSANARALNGIIATGDSFMHEQTRVDFVRDKFPEMIAAEMEAAAIAQVCHRYGTPFVILRALSDIAGKESPLSFDQFLPVAAKNAATIVMKMLDRLN